MRDLWNLRGRIKLHPKGQRSVFNPFEQRIFGLVKLIEGLLTLVFGSRAPSLTLAFALWGAQRNSKRQHGEAT